jgi:hypothetical protein
MAIQNIDQLISASANNGQVIPWQKISATAPTTLVGAYYDLYNSPGFPGTSSFPPSASLGGTLHGNKSNIYDNGLFFTTSSLTNYILNSSLFSTTASLAILVDRLWSCSNLTTTTGSLSTISGSSITRHSGSSGFGEGCEIAYVCFDYTGSIGGGSGTKRITVNYTNSEGVSNRSASIDFGTNARTNYMYFATLQSGDTGVLSIQGSTNTNISFAGGNHGLVVLKKIVTYQVTSAGHGVFIDGFKSGLINIDSDSCLNFIILGTSTNGVTGDLLGNIYLISG